MEPKVLSSFDEAGGDIPDGASILLGGFGPGTAHNLMAALHRQGARDLTLIANTTSPGGGAPQGIVTGTTLVAERRGRKGVLAFPAATPPSRRSPLEGLNEAGEIEAELVPQGTLAERIRAGGAGIPAFYTPTGVGTEVAEGKEHRVFNGRTYILEQAITADYAFVRAWRADEFGHPGPRPPPPHLNPP